MKKLLILCFIMLIGICNLASPLSAVAKDNSTAEEDLSTNIENLLEELDLTAINDYINSLSEAQKKLLGSSGMLERIKKIVSGENKIDYGSFIGYILECIGLNFLHFAPAMVGILAISIAFSIISSIRGKLASDSVENIVNFACIALVVIIVLTQVYGLIKETSNMINTLKLQMNIFFPILLTLMTGIGAGSSVAVYQPSVAILSNGIADLISFVILPAFIFSIVFTIVGNLSEGIKLKKMSDFFTNASKWLLGTAFFLFIAFLSVQGITASVYDGISVRTAKFAISKYVPIIGGYLSEGLNLILAGSVLVKNAIGLTAVILLFVSIIPIVFQIIIFNLSLHLTSAIVEPLGDLKISSLLSGIGKNITMLVAIVLAIAFLYFIFLMLVICTGNLVI